MATTQQHPPRPALTASPSAIHHPAASSQTSSTPARRLPDRAVTAASIEDAFVSFILYCNPGVPPETDSAALREAFRTPPKSGGKSFSTFTLFELIQKLETKELKTWAELALRLGVEPPDQEKGQSSQKIQQYAVRLKVCMHALPHFCLSLADETQRWMHSMHVDAFFEYLIGRQSPYWTEIPSEHTPISELERDGVAAEDDMALRALLPQIKPRRGRRKPDDDETGKSPSQRPSPQPDEYGTGAAAGGRPEMEPWTAQPDGRGSVFLFPPVPDPSRLNPSAPSWANDIVQTPMTAYPIPQSAITPSTRNAFWADEPKSALTPSKARSASRRHGAKVVSSAWRSGGIGTGGKTRGRPPINRGANNEGPFSAFPTSEGPAFRFPSPTHDKSTTPSSSANALTSNPVPTPSTTPTPNGPTTGPAALTAPSPVPTPVPPQNLSPIQESVPPRPAKRSRLSLQVPERVGGEVRLATPPLPAEPVVTPVVMVNGQTTEPQPEPRHLTPSAGPVSAIFSPSPGTFIGASLPAGTAAPGEQCVLSHDPTDRTNVDEIEALFVSSILRADWYDAKGSRISACGVDEAWAFAQRVVENLLKSATTKEAFLINLSALAGGKLLVAKGSLRITRFEELPDRTRYQSNWQLRFGGIVGNWAMEETVMHDKWKKKPEDGPGTAPAPDSTAVNGTGGLQADQWESRYRELAATLQQRDEEMLRLRAKVMESIRDS